MSRSRVSYNFIGITLLAIFCYYVGSFLLVIVRSKGGELDTGISTELSWRLFFQNFPQFAQNIYHNFFGYFEQYSKLYDASNLFLIPLDIITKLLVIGYFIVFWIPFDRQKCYKSGFFSQNYPYLSDDIKKSIDKVRDAEDLQNQKVPIQEDVQKSYSVEKTSLHPQYVNNPYHRAQLLKMSNKQTTSQIPVDLDSEHEDENQTDDVENESFIPFEDIHKPLEQIYEKHEDLIYDIIRRRILPGSNVLLVGYFSTLFIVDYGTIWTVPLYILGVMSMFWCMQTFLMILDFLKFGSYYDNSSL